MNKQSIYSYILKKSPALAFFLFFGFILSAAVPVMCDVNVPAVPGQVKEKFPKNQALKEKWGIELTAMRITAAGHMVDFRYRVLDAEKAAPLFKRQTKPYLIHQDSGKVLAVPNTAKVGSLRNSNIPQNNRIYWMFFGNNGVVKTGDKVTVVIGDFRTENLIVE